MLSERIFSRDPKGSLRFWQYEVEGDRWRGISGIVGKKETASKWTVAGAKNVGRSNATTPEQQAAFEAQAEFDKKLDRNYRRTVEELDAVPPAPMLARKWEDEKDKIEFPVYSQPKLDGIRALISRHGAVSREYQPHLNVDHIMEALAPLFDTWSDLVLDGELYNHDLKDDFNTITSVVRKQKVTDEQRAYARRLIQFHCYDMMLDAPFSERLHERNVLLSWLHDYWSDEPEKAACIVAVPTAHMAKAGLDDLYGSYLEDGFEGQMIRSAGGPYEHDRRSKHLLKRKEFETDEFLCLRVEEGKGNWSGFAKRIVFAVPADWPASGTPLEGVFGDHREVGAGLKGSQEFAAQLLRDKDRYEFKPVTIRYFTPTPDGIPRFPVAIDFHPDGRRD